MNDLTPAMPTDAANARHTGRQGRRPTVLVAAAAFLVLILALALRLTAISQRPVTSASLDALPDQREYLQIAERYRAGYGFSFYDSQFGHTVFAYRMPAYPWLISAFHRPDRADLTQWFQALVDTSTVLAAMMIGWRVGNSALALLAGLAVAVNPYLIYFSTLILTETCFTACLAWAVFLLLARARVFRIAGILLLVAGVYFRPSAIALSPALALVAFTTEKGRGLQPVRGLIAATAAAVVVIAALVPWASRNRDEVGAWVWLTTNDGFTAYDSFNPSADGSSNQAAFRAELASTPMTEVARSAKLSEMAREYAIHHPGRVLSLAVAKLSRFWSPIPLSADFGGRWLYVLVGGAYCVPLFGFAVLGAWRGNLSRQSKIILLAPAIYFSMVHSLAVGSLRYRVPCDVPLAVLAAAGVVSFFERKPAAESA